MVASLLALTEKGTKILEKALDSSESAGATFRIWYTGPQGQFVKYVVRFLVLLSLVNISSSFVRYFFGAHWISINYVRQLIYVAEAIVITAVAANIVFFAQPKLLGNVDPELSASPDLFKSASDASERFLEYWLILWFTWFALYLWLCLGALGVLSNESILVRAITNACNNATGVMIFSMYYEMAERTDVDQQAHRRMIFIPARRFVRV